MVLMGNLYWYQPWKSEGDDADGKSLLGSAMEIRGYGIHGKSLLGSAAEIRGQWRPWEILISIIHGMMEIRGCCYTVMEPMGNPHPDQFWK